MNIFDKIKQRLNNAPPNTQVYPEKNNHEIDIISIDSMDSLSNSNYSITESSDSNSSEYSFDERSSCEIDSIFSYLPFTDKDHRANNIKYVNELSPPINFEPFSNRLLYE